MVDQVSFEVYRESDGARFELVGPEAENVFAEMQKTGFVKVGSPVQEESEPVQEEQEPEQEPETPSDGVKGTDDPVVPEAQDAPVARVRFEPR